MAGLLSGLEKFGLHYLEAAGLYEEEKKEKEAEKPKEAPPKMKEEDYLYDKTHECPVCYATIKERTLKVAKAKLVRTDLDLRPVYENFEPLKYDVVICPHCGFAALGRYFKGLMPFQIKAIRELISASYQPTNLKKVTYTYEDALERYKLSLANAIVKRAKASEKAYICLKTGWLLRSMQENMDGVGPDALEIESLVARVADGSVSEVILALGATMEGDTTNFYIFRKLAPYTDVKITQLARGVAVGNDLEYTDELTLGRSLLQRTLFTETFQQ